MSFFFPVPAHTVVGALDRGLALDETGSLSTDWSAAGQMLADNFSALEDYTAGQATVLLAGTLDAGGNAVLGHGITSAFGLVLVQAWCKGATVGQFLPCKIASVDENNVNVTTGQPNQPVRAFVMYSIVPPGW